MKTSIFSIPRSVHLLSVTANVVLTSPILVTLMIETLLSTDTSVLTRATRRNIPEGDILHSHRRESLKSYMFVSVRFEVFTAVPGMLRRVALVRTTQRDIPEDTFLHV
jgi:hypothetical protein